MGETIFNILLEFARNSLADMSSSVTAPQKHGSEDQQRGPSGQQQEKRKKESILDLTKFLEKSVRVKFAGGREASGILKGFDPLLNLVLDQTIEYLRDPDDPFKLTDDTRTLGLTVCRGPNVTLICPQEGMESIANPFASQE